MKAGKKLSVISGRLSVTEDQPSVISDQFSAKGGGRKAESDRLTTDNCLLTTAQSAFSLIEVVLAVAVIAIGLLAVIGLFPQGLQASRDAADNTIAATIVQDLFSQLRSSPFGTVQICSVPCKPTDSCYPGCQPGKTVGIDLTGIPNPPLNFDRDGFIQDSSPNSSPDYYKVVVACTPSPPPPAVAALSIVQVTVYWPAYQSATTISTINTNVFITTVARYQ